MEHIDQNVWGILHDIKAPLTSLMMALEEICADPEVRGKYGLQVNAAAAGVSQLQNLLSPQRLGVCSIHDEIKVVINSLETFARHGGITISGSIVTHAADIDHRALRRVVSNLIVNAIEACGGCPDAEISVRTYKDSDKYLIDVIDNGAGIEPKYLARVFHPKYSTKGLNRGDGLTIVKNLVEQRMRGKIEVISRATGAHFRVTIPLT